MEEVKRQRQGAILQSWWASTEGLVWGRRRERWGVGCWAGGTVSGSHQTNLSEPYLPAGFAQWEGGIEPSGMQKPARRRWSHGETREKQFPAGFVEKPLV